MAPKAFAAWQRIKIGLNHTAFGLSGTIFNFIFSVIIIRSYSAELWGSFAQFMLMMTFISQVTAWGSKDYLVREFSRNNRLAPLWQTSLISRTVIFLPLIPVLWLSGQDQTTAILFAFWCLANFGARSFDSVIVFERKFKAAVLVEGAGFVMVLIFLSQMHENISLGILMVLFSASAVLKTLLYVALFRKTCIASFNGSMSSQYLILSVPYFLPPLISFLNAKADTFAIALTLPQKEVGEYYILVSLLSYCHAVAALALVPFLKNIYRIRNESLLKIKKSFFLGGMAWAAICLAGTYVALEHIYQIHFDAPVYLVSALALPPFFIYYLVMQEFFKNDKPYTVVYINFAGAVVNFITSLVLIRFLGFIGGLLSFAIMQWIIMAGFMFAVKRLIPASQPIHRQ